MSMKQRSCSAVKKEKKEKLIKKKSADFFRTSNTSSYSEKANIKLPLSQGAFVRV